MENLEDDLFVALGGKNMNKRRNVELILNLVRSELTKLLPLELAEDFDSKSFIGGGAIYSIYNVQEPKDYDFFFNDELYVAKLRKHFEETPFLKYKKGVKMGDYKGHRLIITDNAISIGDYQLITRWVGTPKEVIGQFDFKHNMFYVYEGKLQTLVKWKYLDDNKLRYNEDRARDICGTIIRVKKFVERGFTITNKEMAKMLLRLNEVGFNERELEILHSNDRNDFGS